MEDFKSSPKMQCFKEGGSVKYKSRHSEKSEMSEDIAKDTKMIKKGVKQHESALHKGEPKTELKLKKGGRMKKEGGCVGRYKKGGKVKKYADGRMVGQGAISDTERMRLANRAKNRAMLSPMQQQELDAQEAAAAQKGAMGGGLGSIMGRKKGGKAC